tara:strand:- start:443 stop:1195 length:753 start_codon:yes stop_codon:yes gene_type:complete
MLQEHLNNLHDFASHRPALIEAEVNWIHSEILQEGPSRILDLCCGPGFHLQNLAVLGHQCTGVDFSPASIKYARAQKRPLASPSYIEANILTADIPNNIDLVMIMFGQFDTFSPENQIHILKKACNSLKPGSLLLLEIHSLGQVHGMGTSTSTSRRLDEGLFSDDPHSLFTQNYWYEETRTAVQEWTVIQEGRRPVMYRTTTRAQDSKQFELLLKLADFELVDWYDRWGHAVDVGKYVAGYHILVAAKLK